MQVVIPMSGTGERFKNAGYRQPKPLLPVAGRPVIAHLLDKFPKHWSFVFICNQDHLRTTPLRAVLKKLAPKGQIVSIAPHKRGPVHAVLEAASAIQDREPTIINYCDFSFVWDSDHFEQFVSRSRCDGAVLCYRGFHPQYLRPTLYAYCREENGQILEIKEKGHFTPDRRQEFASSGSYYFRTGALAKRFCRETIRRDLSMNGEYYMSLVYNPMIEAGLNVRVYEIPQFLQWGTPEDLEDYLYWHRTFEFWNRYPPRATTPRAPRLMMPMAGMGTRFSQEGFPPKAFVPVLQRPMFLSAMRYLPASTEKPVVITLQEHAPAAREHAPQADLIALDKPTEGQAITCLIAEKHFDPGEAALISSCDHGLLWNERKWQALLGRKPDVVVVGQRGFPGARRTPLHFAYIQTAPKSDRIERVSVKNPISDAPHKDLLLVGTFYFRQASVLFDMIKRLRERNERVNGELYLDSVVNLCVQEGLDVRCFESHAYLCWGTPDALREFNYWHRYFNAYSDLLIKP
jgi:NDP-sugar pyrophosphorylase family protein